MGGRQPDEALLSAALDEIAAERRQALKIVREHEQKTALAREAQREAMAARNLTQRQWRRESQNGPDNLKPRKPSMLDADVVGSSRAMDGQKGEIVM